MYAIIESGGKQHRVAEGSTIKVELLPGQPGESVEFDRILLVASEEGEELLKVGKPYVEGGKVTGEIVSQGRGKKIQMIKMRRRKHYRKKLGHRQYFTEVKINAIAS